MDNIKYVIGDATLPIGDGPKMILHVCNDMPRWGRGFVLALMNRWPHLKELHIDYVSGMPKAYRLGSVHYTYAQGDIIIGNMIAQHGVNLDAQGNAPIRYSALESCLHHVANHIKGFDNKPPHYYDKNTSVHAPKFGAGLAGGEWAKIEELINKTLISRGILVTIYELEK